MSFENELLNEVNSEITLESVCGEIDGLKKHSRRLDVNMGLKVISANIAKLMPQDVLLCVNHAKKILKLSREEVSAFKIDIQFNQRTKQKKKKINFDIDKNGSIKSSDKNLLNIFKNDDELKDKIKKNTFTDKNEVVSKVKWSQEKIYPRWFSDDDAHLIKDYIINKYDIEFRFISIKEAVKTMCALNQYNPIRDYLNGLKWDGTKRLETFLIDYCGVEDNKYTRWVSCLILCAAVKRVYEPGCKFDHVITLSGNQGVLKSMLIRTLAGEEYFTELTLVGQTRDSVQKMQLAWFIELAEGVSLAKKEMREFKAFATTQKDIERFAYKEFMSMCKRHNIFIMTINPQFLGYLKDETGLRRFLPIRIERDVDIKKIKENRDQLFAEAKYLVNNGFEIYINKDDKELIGCLDNEHFIAELHDDWIEKIEDWLASGVNKIEYYDKELKRMVSDGEPIPDVINCLYVWEKCFGCDPSKYSPQKEGQRIGDALRKLGCKPKDTYKNNERRKGFIVKEIIDNLKNKNKNNIINQAESIFNE